MQTNKSAPSKSLWPIIVFYSLFVGIGILGEILSPKNVILNTFDFIINNYFYYFLPFSIIISYLVINVFYRHREYVELHLGFKLILHAVSVVFISWGFVGSIDFANKVPSKSTPYVLTGQITDMYKKYPSSGYKRTYNKTRYFITIRETKSEKEYTLQIEELLYDSLEFESNAPTLAEDTTSHTFELITKTEKSIPLKIGWLNIIY